jgi:CubicO group peptidase (beta-lactamase class C family)
LCRRSLVDRMRLYDVPGLGVAVISSGRLDWVSGHGVRQAGSTSPVTARTSFQGGSLAKAVTAVAVMRLADERLLSLDRDVNDYLSTWKVPGNGSWQPRVTLRQLLSHTAGATVQGFPGYPQDRPCPTLREILTGRHPANTPAVRIDRLPGTQFQYSGGGMLIVQQLLEDVLRQPFHELMNELVLVPLGMHDSTFRQPLPQHRRTDAAYGHHIGGQPVSGGWYAYPESAAAGLWSTPTDLARVAIELHEAASGGGRLLTKTAVQPALVPQAGGPAGLGFWAEGAGEARRLAADGDTLGFTCSFLVYLKGGDGAVLMTNAARGAQLCYELFGAVAAEYGWPALRGEGRYATAPRTRSPAVLAASPTGVAGSYRLPNSGVLQVVAAGGSLVIVVPGQAPLRLWRVGDEVYDAAVLDVEVELGTRSAGRVETILVRQGGVEAPAVRVDDRTPTQAPEEI